MTLPTPGSRTLRPKASVPASVSPDGVDQRRPAALQAIDWWEASAGEAVGQGAHAEEALRMLERACGLADVLADYYRNNQQVRVGHR